MRSGLGKDSSSEPNIVRRANDGGLIGGNEVLAEMTGCKVRTTRPELRTSIPLLCGYGETGPNRLGADTCSLNPREVIELEPQLRDNSQYAAYPSVLNHFRFNSYELRRLGR